MKKKRVPLRQCVGCREMKEKNCLIRIVKTPEGDIIPDETGKRNGRGAYLCRNTECLRKAEKAGGISRSLQISVSKEVYRELESELIKYDKQ
ncbi:MAG: YlxR family protein [Lachnoclostridium sp.]|jgi:predicted RNA-binding protein YlxR (DUF448 family)|nr:YlxR family protein [Lachnoclostridium sp.]